MFPIIHFYSSNKTLPYKLTCKTLKYSPGAGHKYVIKSCFPLLLLLKFFNTRDGTKKQNHRTKDIATIKLD